MEWSVDAVFQDARRRTAGGVGRCGRYQEVGASFAGASMEGTVMPAR